MKEKIQKYLAGEREGFSLVELIIVIAIMAILIGVIALAVIPYLARSRESKDLQALDAINSALATGVATAQATDEHYFIYTGTKKGGTDEANKVHDAMVDSIGQGAPSLSVDKTAKIICHYNAKTGSNVMVTYAATDASKDGDKGTAVELTYNETGFVKDTTDGVKKGDAGKALAVSN